MSKKDLSLIKPYSKLNKPHNEVYLILDNIRSILNVGAIFRTADAIGVKKIYLCGITGYPSKKEIHSIDKIIINEPISINEKGEIKINYIPSKKCFDAFLLPRIRKTALLSTSHIDWVYKASTDEAINELKKDEVKIIALEQSKDSIDYLEYSYNNHCAILVGNEVSGIDEETLKKCDDIIEIGMIGHSKSLNVATATGIILFKLKEVLK